MPGAELRGPISLSFPALPSFRGRWHRQAHPAPGGVAIRLDSFRRFLEVAAQDPRPQRFGRIQALPWEQGILAV